MHLPCQEWNGKHLDWGIAVDIWRHINIFFFVFASEALSDTSLRWDSQLQRERERERESRGSSIWVTLCWRRRQSGFPPAIQRHITQHIKTRHRPLTHNPPLKQKRLQNDHKHPSHSRAGHTSESIQITTDLSCAKLTNAMLRGSWWLLTVPTVKTSQAAAIFWSLYGFSMQVWQI